MNRLETIQATVARRRLHDGSYADVRINGADLAVLLDIARTASEMTVCPCCDYLHKFGHEAGCTLGALLKEVTD